MRSAAILMLVAAITLAGASAIHFGVSVDVGSISAHDPFAGAALPEGVHAVIVAAGAVWVLAGMPNSWGVGVAAAVVGLLVVLFGMSITIRGGRTGDIAYHVTVFVILLLAALQLVRSRRRSKIVR